MDTRFTQPRAQAFYAVIAVCLLPLLLNLLGVDFSSYSAPIPPSSITNGSIDTDAVFASLSGALHHALLEWSAVGVAIIACIISFIHFLRHNNIAVPIIGLALLCAGSIDTFHTLAATRIISATASNADFIPFTWVLSRIFNASIMLVGIGINLWISFQHSRQDIYHYPSKKNIKILIGISALFFAIAYFTVHWAANSALIPQTTYPNALISRPYDILPLALFLIGGSLIWSWYQYDRSLVKYALLLSIFPEIATQLHMAFGSSALYDNHFNIAHALKIVAYFTILIGFTLDLSLNKSKNELESSKNPLHTKPEGSLHVGHASRPLIMQVPLAVFGLALFICILVSVSFFMESKRVITQQIHSNLKLESRSVHQQLSRVFKDTYSTIFFLSDAPPIQKIAGQEHGNDAQQLRVWTDRLNQIFTGVLETKPDFLSIHFTQMEGYGKELVAVKREHNHILRVPKSRLQSKTDRSYFINSLSLNIGDVFFSKVALDREKGLITLPHTPTIKVATPVFNKLTGEIFGTISIKINFEKVLNEIQDSMPSSISFSLANEEGDYLQHYEPHKTFGFDLGTSFRIQDDYPNIKNALETKAVSLSFVDTSPLTDIPLYYSLLDFNHSGNHRLFHLLLHYNANSEFEQLTAFRNRSLILGISLALLALALAIIASKKVIQTLSEMTTAIEIYERTGQRTSLPTSAKDEIGVFARSFHNMLLQVDMGLQQQMMLTTSAKETSDRLEAIVNSAADAIITINEKGSILSFNHTAEEIFGYRTEEVIGKNVNILMPQPYSREHDQYLHKYSMTHKSKIMGVGRNLPGKRRSGEEFPLHLGISEVSTHQGRIFIGVIRDISEQVKAEKEKDENLALLTATLESTDNGILVTNSSGRFIQSNKRFGELWGLPDSLLKNCDEQSILSFIEGNLITPEHFRHNLRNSHIYHNQEIKDQLRFLDGRVFEYVSLPMKVEGKSLGRVWCFRDMTERQNYENALIEAKNAAEEMASAKSEFLATMSHEIRTPMNGVIGMLNLLKNTELSDDQFRKVHLAQSSAHSLLTLINDILDFSKVDAGKLELEALEFNLRKQLGDFAEAIALRAQEKGLEIILNLIDIEETTVIGDPGRLRQVLTNLVGNAIKFTEQGEIEIKARLSRRNQEQWIFSCEVIDSGIGIPDDKIENLFESFSQVDASTTRKFGGTGLGLAISKKLCQIMGGDIEANSILGKGSNFRFHLRFNVSTASEPIMPEEVNNEFTLLVVDDNAKSRQHLKSQFEHWGVTVGTATNGMSALKCLDERADHGDPPFDGILIDLKMPQMDGEQLSKKIREDQRFQTCKLLLMTNLATQHDTQYYKNLGVSAYFPKPVTTNDLLNIIALLNYRENSEEEGNRQSIRPVAKHALKQEKKEFYSANQQTPHQPVWPSQTRLLLVEDNHINQEVALGALEEIGLSADTAGSGIEALSALKSTPIESPYTLILMDCQMPDMDGYEATQQIRKGIPGSQYKDIPIVAMTANAMSGDEEKCIASGMSDYLTKPIDIDLLEEKLLKWIGNHKKPSDSSETG